MTTISLGGLLLSACGSDDDEAGGAATGVADTVQTQGDLVPVDVQSVAWIGVAPWFVAVDQKLDEQNGIKLNHTLITQIKEATAAIGAGRVDAALASPGQALIFVAAGLPVKHVLLYDLSDTADAVLADPSISSVADLKGETVGVEPGSAGDFMLRYALKEAGLSMSDINAVNLPGSDAATALKSGQVKAAVTYEPYISGTLDDFPILYKAGDKPGIVGDIMNATESFATDSPETLVNTLKTWQAGVDFYNENPEEAQRITAEGLGTSYDELKTSFDGVKIFSLEESIDFFENDWPELAPIYIDILNETGELPEELTEEQALAVVDMSFAQQALADQ
jgi:NitT/TauT family transport system substrate-binding protein